MTSLRKDIDALRNEWEASGTRTKTKEAQDRIASRWLKFVACTVLIQKQIKVRSCHNNI